MAERVSQEGPLLDQLDRPMLRDRAAASVRSLLFRGELVPGSAIREQDLSAQLGVSRNPVREALIVLEAEGLITFHGPQRGYQVLELTDDYLSELYSIRAVLEGAAAEFAAADPSDADLDVLQLLTTEMSAAYRVGDLTRLGHLDMTFHGKVVAMAGHSLLSQSWERYRNIVTFAMAVTLRPTYSQIYGIDRAHKKIVDVIAQRNQEEARRIARDHVLHYLNIYLGTSKAQPEYAEE
jgi:DNA-binding GntR family transcriptional regulator